MAKHVVQQAGRHPAAVWKALLKQSEPPPCSHRNQPRPIRVEHRLVVLRAGAGRRRYSVGIAAPAQRPDYSSLRSWTPINTYGNLFSENSAQSGRAIFHSSHNRQLKILLMPYYEPDWSPSHPARSFRYLSVQSSYLNHFPKSFHAASAARTPTSLFRRGWMSFRSPRSLISTSTAFAVLSATEACSCCNLAHPARPESDPES
jgi:hypothetical protein